MRFKHSPEASDVLSIKLEGGFRNELDVDTLRGLTRLIQKHQDKVIIISAAGRTFSAGLDIEQMVRQGSGRKLLTELVALYTALGDHPCATACLVEKPAIGGGVGLALCADVVIMKCSASFRLPDNPLYRPLAEVLFPLVASRRGVTRQQFDRWYRGNTGAAELHRNGHVDRVIHPKQGKRVTTAQLREVALRVLDKEGLLERDDLIQGRRRPDHDEMSRLVERAVEATKRPAFRVSARVTLKNIKRNPRSVFIVHGRNEEALRVLNQQLAGLGLRQLTLAKVQNELGATSCQLWDLIYTGQEMAQAVIVLMTGDDEARLREGLAGKLLDQTRQARQNVLIEAGLALGMCPKRTILICTKAATVPSDFHGFLRVDVPGGVDWRTEVSRLLKIAGCTLKTNKTKWPDEDDLNDSEGG